MSNEELAKGLLPFMEEMQTALRESVKPFWEIIKELAETSNINIDIMDDRYCSHCSGEGDSDEETPDDFNHKRDCIVMKARALMKLKDK